MITWHERSYGNLIATDDNGLVIGRVSLNLSSGLYCVSENKAHGEYLSKDYAKEAVARAALTQGAQT